MKKLLILIAIFIHFTCQAQVIVPSTCAAPDSIYWKYRDDADKMAVRRVYHINHNYQDSIVINKQIRDNYLNALIAVYNATAIPARDSVVKMLNIHIFGNNVNQVSLRVDSNQTWIKNVKAHITPCGEPKMDYYMSKYYLKEIKHYPHLLQPTTDVILQADTNCNTEPLADTLKKLPGVLLSDGGIYGSLDGNNIEDSITVNYTWLVYSVGWDNNAPIGQVCPAGCPYRRFWQFKVYNDCSVEYGGTFGAPIDVGIKEYEAKELVKIYPNPFNSQINFDIPDERKIKLRIMDILGQEIIGVETNENKFSISTSDLLPGVYLYTIWLDNTQIKTGKIIKE